MGNTKILTADQESQLRQPIDAYVGDIQAKIDALRAEGTDKVLDIQSSIDSLKRDRIYTQQEKAARLTQLKAELQKAKSVEASHKDEVAKLIADAENYLNAHFDKEYFQPVAASCVEEKAAAQEKYKSTVAQLNKEHQETLAKLSDQKEIKDEKYVQKNRLFDAKMQLAKDLQAVKDRRHAAYDHRYHLIDMLRMSKFTFGQSMAQRLENYRYTFNRRDFLLRNGHHRYLHRPVHHHSHRQGHSPADGEQYPEHPPAGLPQNVPGSGRGGADPAGRYGSVHRSYGGYGHDRRHHRDAPGDQHRLCLRTCL